MSQKFVHKVSPELTDDAQFKAVSDIPTVALKQGSTVLMYPGTYSAISMGLDNITLEGVGDRADVVLNTLTLSNASANTVVVKNMTVVGTNAASESGVSAVEIMDLDNAVNIEFYGCKFTTAPLAARHHGTGTIRMDFCDASGVDAGIQSNADAFVNYSSFGANAYFQSGVPAAAADPNVTSRVSTGAANTGPTVQTIIAVLS